VFDESVESAARLTHLIDSAVAGDREHAAAPAPASEAPPGGSGATAAQPSGSQRGDPSRR